MSHQSFLVLLYTADFFGGSYILAHLGAVVNSPVFSCRLAPVPCTICGCQTVTRWAQQPDIIRLVVSGVTVNMVHLKHSCPGILPSGFLASISGVIPDHFALETGHDQKSVLKCLWK